MKVNNTYILFDSAQTSTREDWTISHQAILEGIASLKWPETNVTTEFRIPRIVTLSKGSSYIDPAGKSKIVRKSRGTTLRNGVKPIRNQFRTILASRGWKAEHTLSLAPYFKQLRDEAEPSFFSRYPPSQEQVEFGNLNESVGDFDFWFQTDSGFRTVVEWETGNISSSHRSLNKMCLALLGGLADAGVLVVPSVRLYPHLTDRIGNIRELQPYFYFWKKIGSLAGSGLLAVIEVEHDKLFQSSDCRDFIPTGLDGNSKRPRTSKSPKKRKNS